VKRILLNKVRATLKEAIGHLVGLADLVHIYAVNNPRAIAAGKADAVRSFYDKARRFLTSQGRK
jgi:hypothetical protein